jgi:hypothetical protein
MSNIFQEPDNKPMLDGYNFWLKFGAILFYLSGGSLISTIIGIPFGIFYIIMGIKLWESASIVNSISHMDSDISISEASFKALEQVKSHFKILGLMTIIGTAVGIAFAIILFFFIIIAAVLAG